MSSSHVVLRFDGGHHYRLHSEGFGRVLRRRFAKAEVWNDGRANFREAGFLEKLEELSLRESTAYSAGPEFWIIDYRLRELLRTHDVRDRHTSTGSQHAEYLFNYAPFPE